MLKSPFESFVEWATKSPIICFIIILKDVAEMTRDFVFWLKTGVALNTPDWWDFTIKLVVAFFLYGLLRYLGRQIEKVSQVEQTLLMANNAVDQLNEAIKQASNSQQIVAQHLEDLSVYTFCINYLSVKKQLGSQATDNQIQVEYVAQREELHQALTRVMPNRTQNQINRLLDTFHGKST